MTTLPVTALLPIVFALAGLIACGTIWMTLSHYRNDIRNLRRQLRAPATGADIQIIYRPDSYQHGTDIPGTLRAIRRKRHNEIGATKWSAHRLHHFQSSKTAA